MTPPTSTDSAERRCVADERCREYDKAKKRAALLGIGSPPLCPDCLRHAERDVRALPSDYVALEQLLPPSLGEWSDGQPKRGRGELPLPLREYVLVLQRHIWWVATAWEPVVRELDRLSDEIRVGVREGFAAQRAVEVIAPRLEKLAAVGQVDMADYPPVDDKLSGPVVWGDCGAVDHTTPTGADGILHMVRLHSLARTMTGLTSPVRHLPGFCHECKQDDVLRQHQPKQRRDDPPVWCEECGAWQPYDTYERMMKLVVWQGA